MADEARPLILIEKNGKLEDYSDKIASIEKNGYYYKIRYKQGNATEYTYSHFHVVYLENYEVLNTEAYHIYYEGKELYGISQILKYFDNAKGVCYLKIIYKSGYSKFYNYNQLRIEVSSLTEKTASDCFSYLKEIAEANGLRSDNGEKVLLSEQYKKIDFVRKESVLSYYLNPEKTQPRQYTTQLQIFPFGGNSSQFKAVGNALSNQLSVIQGPPGTGKTQTILNIIANLLYRGKSILVVSNNNSAIKNVQEKLCMEEVGLGFLSAMLGNTDNKKLFIASQNSAYPDMNEWKLAPWEKEQSELMVLMLQKEIDKYFKNLETAARIRQQLEALKTEELNFNKFCDDADIKLIPLPPEYMISQEALSFLWTRISCIEETRIRIFLFRLEAYLRYSLSFKLFKGIDQRTISASLQSALYKASISKLTENLTNLEKSIEESNQEEKLNSITILSLKLLKNRIYSNFENRKQRTIFEEDDLWKHGKEVQKEYPIVLSTTFSAISSLSHVKYDYLIMDEASQVDIPTGALSLAVADNAVIIGDEYQLPNIITMEDKTAFGSIYRKYKIKDIYECREGNSFLNSIKTITPLSCCILLKEHYRCNPRIIGFCNQKFYNNELIIMTKEKCETNPIEVLRTAKGNHSRSDKTNHREAEEIKKEIIPKLKDEQIIDIGVISPYRNQTILIRNELNDRQIETSTVHKFQGREKDAIVFSVVDDEISSFADNPYLLNVAVSRARKKFCLVVTGNQQSHNGNIADLISYINYSNGKLEEGKLYSVFDLLYKQSEQQRIKLLKKYGRISDFDSENLMYSLLNEIIISKYNGRLCITWHYPLRELIRHPDRNKLGEDRFRFASSSLAHVDFLIYKNIGKVPILAIEVDGYSYHDRNPRQLVRDRMKDEILSLYDIPFLRLNTTGSGEQQKIEQELERLMESD